MIAKGRNASGQAVYVGNMKDLAAINDWAQALMHATYGPEEGERRYKSLSASAAFDVWAKKASPETLP
jgi:hypothetical protein